MTKDVTKLSITYDLDKMKIRDLNTLDKAGRNEATFDEILEVLDRVVEGGASDLPIEALQPVMLGLSEVLEATWDPQDGEAGEPSPSD